MMKVSAGFLSHTLGGPLTFNHYPWGLDLGRQPSPATDDTRPACRRKRDHECPAEVQATLMTTPDPLALLRSRSYLALLVLAAIIGVPVSAVAYFFLALVGKMQGWIFTDLPVGAHVIPQL